MWYRSTQAAHAPRHCMRSAAQLRPSRHWFIPLQHRMLSLFSPLPSAAALSCHLTSPALAYLKEHTVNRRSILPGAAMFEVAYAAAAILAAGDEQGCKDRLVLAGCSIAAPFLLQQAASGNAKASQDKLPALVCSLQQGTVRLSSGKGSTVHLHASAASFAARPSHSATHATAEQQQHSSSGALCSVIATAQQAGTRSDADAFDGALGSMENQVGCPSMLLCK